VRPGQCRTHSGYLKQLPASASAPQQTTSVPRLQLGTNGHTTTRRCTGTPRPPAGAQSLPRRASHHACATRGGGGLTPSQKRWDSVATRRTELCFCIAVTRDLRRQHEERNSAFWSRFQPGLSMVAWPHAAAEHHGAGAWHRRAAHLMAEGNRMVTARDPDQGPALVSFFQPTLKCPEPPKIAPPAEDPAVTTT
jgi:hypothetical protein